MLTHRLRRWPNIKTTLDEVSCLLGGHIYMRFVISPRPLGLACKLWLIVAGDNL